MEFTNLRTAIEILQNQSVKGTEFTLNMSRVFLLLSEQPGLTQKEIVQITDISIGSIGKIISSLGIGNHSKGGLKLIKGQDNSFDYRSQCYFLTNKGLELALRLSTL